MPERLIVFTSEILFIQCNTKLPSKIKVQNLYKYTHNALNPFVKTSFYITSDSLKSNGGKEKANDEIKEEGKRTNIY